MPLHRPIFILGAHKSGTSLLRSLFDGHPDLFAIPFETHLFQMAGFWVDYRMRRNMPASLDFADIKRHYIALVEEYNTSGASTADAQLQGQLDVTRFRQCLDHEVGTFTELVERYFEAAYISLYDAPLPETARVVEKSVEHAEYALDLLGMFPDARFVHVVRNPYANLAAIRRTHAVNYQRRRGWRHYPLLVRAVDSLRNSAYHLERNRRLIEHYQVIRYEDLLTTPDEVMRDLAAFLDMAWHDTLLQPTSVGGHWVGNSSQGMAYSGIDARNLDAWQADVEALEIYCVNKLLPFVLDQHGYPALEPSRSPWLPIVGELPHIYLMNRLITRML